MDDNEHQEQPDPRGGSLSGLRAALTRPAGDGLTHWGGPLPRRRDPAPGTEGTTPTN